MTFRSLSSQSICTFSVCARASARGPQPLSWNLARASHSAALHLSPVLDHQSILCIYEFISSFKDTTCKLHYPFNLGFNNPRFFLGFFFFFSVVPNKIPLQLFNLFQLGDEAEVCILSHPLEAPVTHSESVLSEFTEFPYLPHQVDISPFTSC